MDGLNRRQALQALATGAIGAATSVDLGGVAERARPAAGARARRRRRRSRFRIGRLVC